MNLLIRNIALPIIAALALAGCLRDDIQPCKPMTARVTIIDRQFQKEMLIDNSRYDFSNDKFDEHTPFKEIVPTLYCVLHDVATGQIVKEFSTHSIDDDGDDTTHTILFPDSIPFGKYILTVWGGLDNDDQLFKDGTAFDIGTTNADIFMANDTINFSAGNSNFDLGMHRINGKVVIETIWETLPKHLDSSYKVFSNVNTHVDANLQYSHAASKDIDFSWTSARKVISETILPPSTRENGTCMKLRYFSSEDPDKYYLDMPDVYITIKRNQVTHLRYTCDPYTGAVNVMVFVNGEWRQANEMAVD